MERPARVERIAVLLASLKRALGDFLTMYKNPSGGALRTVAVERFSPYLGFLHPVLHSPGRCLSLHGYAPSQINRHEREEDLY